MQSPESILARQDLIRLRYAALSGLGTRKVHYMRLLLVDDSEFARRAYREGLSRSGIEMDVASSAREALARVSREAYDVIVSDVNMPGMSGIDFLKAIRQIDLDLPVVLTTGSPTVETAAEAVEYGAYRY